MSRSTENGRQRRKGDRQHVVLLRSAVRLRKNEKITCTGPYERCPGNAVRKREAFVKSCRCSTHWRSELSTCPASGIVNCVDSVEICNKVHTVVSASTGRPYILLLHIRSGLEGLKYFLAGNGLSFSISVLISSRFCERGTSHAFSPAAPAYG